VRPAFLADLSQTIRNFHDLTIQLHGGLPGFRDQGLFQFAVDRPWMTAFGEPIFKTPFQKASAIAEAIARTHPFNDGNHRTALAAAELVLGIQGLRLAALPEAKLSTIRTLGSGATSLEEFAVWLEQNSLLRSQITS